MTRTITLSQFDLAAITRAHPSNDFDGIHEIRFTIDDVGCIVGCDATVSKDRNFAGPALLRAANIALARYAAQKRGQQCQVIEFKTCRD
jgi:succinate dehydrogenase/fumarate reductase-like Fe-S protein